MADEGSVLSPSPEEILSSPEDDPVEKAKKCGKIHHQIDLTNLLQWMTITVSEPEKRTTTSMKMQDTFIVYMIETRITDNNMKCFGDGTTTLWRRYSEFELVRNYLEVTYPTVIIPPLPEKKASYIWQNAPTDKFDPEFIERRRAALEIYLLRLAAHPQLSQDKIFIGFLQQEIGWRDSVYATDFQNKGDSRLKALNAALRLKKPDRRFEDLKNYSNEMQTNITNLLKIRAKLADRLYGIHKVHANYGRVFCEWSSIEKDMTEPLHSAGHYMNVFSQSIDNSLDEEEQYADQLKEYLAFGDSLRAVCRKYECMQFDLERAEDSLSYKAGQRENLIIKGRQAQGKPATGFSFSGVKSKIFGGDTTEQREQKLKQLDEQLKIAEADLKKVNEETTIFVEAALKDIDRFKRQKVKDLREIFTNYAVMQIKQCKKGIAIWTSAKDCFTKM